MCIDLAAGLTGVAMPDSSTSIREKNAAIQKQIDALEKQKIGMSHGSVDYPRITNDILTLAAQLQPEPPQETPLIKLIVVGALGSVIGGLILYYIFKII